MRQEVSRVTADNHLEQTVILKTETFEIDWRTGQRTSLIDTSFTGPFYPDMLNDWVNRAKRNGSGRTEHTIMNANAVRFSSLNKGLIARPYKRWLVTYDDGSTGYQYTVAQRG